MSTKNTLKISRVSFISMLEKAVKDLQALQAEYAPLKKAYDKAAQAHELAEKAHDKANGMEDGTFADLVKIVKSGTNVRVEHYDYDDMSGGKTEHTFKVFVTRPTAKDFPELKMDDPSDDPKFKLCVNGGAQHRIDTINQTLRLLKISTDEAIVVSTFRDVAAWI